MTAFQTKRRSIGVPHGIWVMMQFTIQRVILTWIIRLTLVTIVTCGTMARVGYMVLELMENMRKDFLSGKEGGTQSVSVILVFQR